MRLLRTAADGFINAARIARLADERERASNGWVATLDNGEEIARSRYYSAPGRIERELPDLAAMPASMPMAADCPSERCCLGESGLT